MRVSLVLLMIIGCAQVCLGQRSSLGKAYASKQVKSAIKDKEISQLGNNLFAIDKETAIAVAEVYLFKAYGKKQILKERPYEVYLINGYWWMMGTPPKGFDGRGFELIMNAKNGQIVRFSH